MHRYAQKMHQLIRSLLLLSVITATGAQAAEKIDLIIDTVTDSGDHTGHLVTEACRQTCLRRGQVLTPERVIPADADRLDTHLHFARTWLSSRMLFAFEHLGRTKLVKTDRAGHRKPRQSNL